jgi:hypothetical protein
MKSYTKMTRAERRVAIAKDAMAYLQDGLLTPTSGVYVAFGGTPGGYKSKTADEILNDDCTVCALGALFIARASNRATAKMQQREWMNVSRSGCRSELRTAFSVSELKEIEAAFEGWMEYEDDWYIRSSSDRLLTILQNIIDHDGDFRPEVEYDIV